ncbi:MAG: hypothetical protein ACJ8AD_13595 [Gemmatimonadaceae bacterium]
MPSTRSRRVTRDRLVSVLVLTFMAACASAPATPPRLATAKLTVSNPLEAPIQVYQLYQARSVFDPRLSSALCEPLGEVPARDSARFIITAGATDYIGVVFQADSLNGTPAGVSRAMQAREGDELHWTLTRDMRVAIPLRPQRGVMNAQGGTGPGGRERNRC